MIRHYFEEFILRNLDVIALLGVLGLHIAFFANSGNAIPILSKMPILSLITVIALTVCLNAVSGLIAYRIAKKMNVSYEDHATIAMSGAMRSNGIALVVGMKTFPGFPLITVPAAIYSFAQHIISGQIAKALNKRALVLEQEKLVQKEMAAIQSFDTQFILNEESKIQASPKESVH